MSKSAPAPGLLVCLALLNACGSGSRPAEPGVAQLPLAHVDPATAGVIRGAIRFQGRPPEMATVDFSSNPQCEREHPKPVKAETVVINSNGTLRDTLVWIKSGLPAARWAAPAQAVKLDQSGCVYKPHVLALMVDQQLDIANSDPVNHDVHVEASANPASNDSEPPRAETLQRRFAVQEIWFPITCSVHPWMRSYISVVAHPFFAVTGTDGSYELRGVPPGSYVVETIQEKYGRQQQHVTVTARQTAIADFTYAE